jgi:pimeloyl-ACP methyl ester carboxylesterase
MAKDKIKIVVVHGWSFSDQNSPKWQSFISLIQAAGYEVNFLDLPGFAYKIDKPWSLDDYASWLDGQIGELAAKSSARIVLLGHSFGGQIAVRYLATQRHSGSYSSGVSKLILMDSAGIVDHRLFKKIKKTVFWVLAKLGKMITKSQVAKKLLYKLAREHDYEKSYPELRTTLSMVVVDSIESDLVKIKLPTLIIWGGQDTATPLFMGQKINSLIVGSRLTVIDQAKHAPQATHPDQVVSAITMFFTTANSDISGDQK